MELEIEKEKNNCKLSIKESSENDFNWREYKDILQNSDKISENNNNSIFESFLKSDQNKEVFDLKMEYLSDEKFFSKKTFSKNTQINYHDNTSSLVYHHSEKEKDFLSSEMLNQEKLENKENKMIFNLKNGFNVKC